MRAYPPDTDDLQALAGFFDRTDITELEGLEEVEGRPQRQMVAVTVRLPKEDVEELKRRAKKPRPGLHQLDPGGGAAFRRALDLGLQVPPLAAPAVLPGRIPALAPAAPTTALAA